jgi:dTMP kinase
MIITFEGIEGSGKTLHIDNVSRHLKKKKISFVKLREPGGSKNSEKIRKLILNNKTNFNKYTDLFLYLAARSENIEKIIIKNYQKKVILIDRFTDSTLAYQHYGMGISKKIIEHLNKYLLKKIKINFTFLNIVNEKNLKKRLFKRKRLNRYDKFKHAFYKKVQKGFIRQAKLKSSKYLIVNSNIKVQDNKRIIINKINKILDI